MSIDHEAPPDIDAPEDCPGEARSLYRLLAYARLTAFDLNLPQTERLIEAALRSLAESYAHGREAAAAAYGPNNQPH